MSFALELAHRIAAIRAEALPDSVLTCAKSGLLDSIGVMLAGAREDAVSIAERVHGDGAGPCVVVGRGYRGTALNAALLNGIAANVVDFDDCADHLGGHPSAPMLPALLALAESSAASGRDLLAAYVAGFETECRLGRAVNFHHYEKGWHATATLGVFGATAACAHLLRLDDRRTASALASAASFSAGVKANLGTMMKPLQVGQAARHGLLAALLAREGFTSNIDAFEHKQGWLNLFNGPGTFDLSRALDGWGEPYQVVMPGIAIKQYPCCLSLQSALDAMIDLVSERDIRSQQVARIESFTHPRRLEHTNRPDPRSALDAKLSIQYCLSRGLMHRRVGLEHFEGDRHREPEVRRMMERVTAGTYPEDSVPEGEDFTARLRVTLQDGSVHETSIARPVGHEPGVALPVESLERKFVACAGRLLPPETVETVRATVRRFETIANVNSLTALLLGPPRA